MANSFEAGALLGHTYQLEDETHLRLRLARGSDLRAITELLEHAGVGSDEPSAARLVYFDPRRQYVLCATALVEGHEALLGIGAIKLDRSVSEPDLLVLSGRAGEEVRRLLTSALVATARAITRDRAA